MRFLCCFAFLFVVVNLTGCNPGTTVSGDVTLDGDPLPNGSIQFVPVDGQTATAGTLIKNGRFSVAVPPGRKRVLISAPKVVGKKKLYPTPNSPEQEITEERLPARYNTKSMVELEVVPGSNPVTYPLTSR